MIEAVLDSFRVLDLHHDQNDPPPRFLHPRTLFILAIGVVIEHDGDDYLRFDLP